ncbi:hypothetical protein FBU30_001410 [Linnemannia zychae]|nr:hypothetical protein FBU30_001410 [Linnemannia zychae]
MATATATGIQPQPQLLQQQQQQQDYSEFIAAEGRYELLQDFHLDHVLPHPVIPTYVSSVSVKYKDYLNNSSSGGGGGGKKGGGGVFGSVLDQLDEQLRDLKFPDDRATDDAEEATSIAAGQGGGGSGLQLSGNFHGNLVDLPLYNEEGGPTGAGGGNASLGLTPPGPPPLKDSTSFGRLPDFSSNHGSHVSNTHSRTLGRASSFPQQLYEEGPGSGAMGYQGGGGLSYSATIGPSTPASSASFSAFFTGKRKKPKSSIGKTNSTFVAKFTTNENLAKILANRVNEDIYLFWNTGRTFTWSDLGQKPNAIIKDSAVTMIKWLPGSESQFMVAFQDGSIVMMDKDKDDNNFSTPTPPDENGFHATKPKHSRHNPISHWHISKKPINAFAFSPDLQHVAVVAADGELRIIDFRNERLIETFRSYFGALNCVCWSPDGKYILTGGQDDLVTIWSFRDLRIVARCQGHQNYVTGVAFDSWRCDERNYRFGSVGEDAKLLLWDFSVGSLHKPKAVATQRHGNNTTAHGAGTFKPGHANKGSITSLRGLGGHSLFNHNNHTPNLSQHTLAVASPLASNSTSLAPSGTASETVSIDSASVSSIHELGQDSSILGASTTELSASFSNNEGAGGGGLSISGETTSLNSSLTSSMTTFATAESAGSANTPSKPARKALQHAAKTLPHLHFTRSFNSSNSNSSINNATSQQQQPQNNLSAIFNHPNHTTSNNTTVSTTTTHHYHHPQKSDDTTGVTPTTSTMHGSVDNERDHLVAVARPPERRSRVAMLQPLMATAIHHEPLASITFREDAILTSDRRGHIKVWKRPPPPAAPLVSSNYSVI